MMYEQFTQFTKMFHNLSLILDKAQKYADAKKIEPDTLGTLRLTADMLPLVKQVQIACDAAKLGAARLTGKDAPVNDDKEKTLPELKARLETTMGFLSSLKEADFKGWEERKITQPRWEGKWMTGKEYFHQHVVPNVYFHVTTTYAILRQNGVEIGKKDYLGDMPFKH